VNIINMHNFTKEQRKKLMAANKAKKAKEEAAEQAKNTHMDAERI